MPRGILNRLRRLLRGNSQPEDLLQSFESEFPAHQSAWFRIASSSGLPRGLNWVRCDWPDTARVLIRDRHSAEISLLASVNISFSAVEGGDMEDVPAVSLVRDATAVFLWTTGQWSATGRTIFNLNPVDAAKRLEDSHERLL